MIHFITIQDSVLIMIKELLFTLCSNNGSVVKIYVMTSMYLIIAIFDHSVNQSLNINLFTIVLNDQFYLS